MGLGEMSVVLTKWKGAVKMGYEVKMFIGNNCVEQPSMVKKNKGHTWFQVVAEIDLCKTDVPFPLLNALNPVYLFGLDGNKEYAEDRYGEKLKAYDAKEVLKLIQKCEKADKVEHIAKYPNDKYVPYRRHEIAIAMLKVAIKTFKTERLSVCFFGH
jgi:predicted Zn-dependent protease